MRPRPGDLEKRKFGKLKANSWSVMHHHPDGEIEEIHVSAAGFAITKAEAAVEVHRFDGTDPTEKGWSAVFKNGQLFYRKPWHKKYGYTAAKWHAMQVRKAQKAAAKHVKTHSLARSRNHRS